jgi:two-component system chemotaxis response regulator CheB
MKTATVHRTGQKGNIGYKAVVIGVSAGGLTALSQLFSCLGERFFIPLIVVQHVHPTATGYRYTHFNNRCRLTIKEAEDKEKILPGFIYFAPPDYHLLVERDETFSLSIDARVNFSRPSIDVLFESAAYAFSSGLIGILLTGANNDGAYGMRVIRSQGGFTIAQDPSSAEYPTMPQSAVDAHAVDKIYTLQVIGEFLNKIPRGFDPKSPETFPNKADQVTAEEG